MIRFILIFIFLCSSATFAQGSKKQNNGGDFSFLNDKTSIRDPYKLRDPFKRYIPRDKIKQRTKFGGKKNQYSNLKKMGDVSLDEIAIVGVFIGPERRAMAKIRKGKSLGRDVFILKEGMSIGDENAEVKAILPGGIVIVEKITNVYNQSEYVETIIPVHSE